MIWQAKSNLTVGQGFSLAKKPRFTLTVLPVVFGLAFTFSLPAVAEERMPGVIERPPVEAPETLKKPPEELEKKEPDAEPFLLVEGTITLKEVKFSGALIFGEKDLNKIAKPYLDRPLTSKDMASLKYDLTTFYYDRGYILVKIVTPPQDLTDGVLDVTVYAGRIGEVETRITGINPYVVNAMKGRLIKGDIFNERAVETAITDINDIANLKAKLSLRPGKEFGTTDMLIDVSPAKEDVQQIMVDNYGSKLTGEWVGTLNLKKTNLLKTGETFGLTYRKSEDNLDTVDLDFSIPIGISNLRLELDYLNSKSEIGGRLDVLDASGESERYGAALSGKIMNMLQRQLSWRAGLEKRRHESFLADVTESDDAITRVYLETAYLYRASKYVAYAGFTLSKGVGLFGADGKEEIDASRASGDPRAWRLEPVIYLGFHPTFKDKLYAFITGQFGGSVLLASDLFTIGGYGSVRGFSPAQETGDSGVQATVEYSHKFAVTGKIDMDAAVFFDGASVSNRLPGAAVDSNLYSGGAGIEFVGRFFGFGDTKARMDFAVPIGSYRDTNVADDTFYLRVVQRF
ncbi:MAG: ShlB/FhaC/HecB family hemolysin secretion/activation protein [Thermodesulfobacteriota bacterium]